MTALKVQKQELKHNYLTDILIYIVSHTVKCFVFTFTIDPNRVIHTEMMLAPEEFDNYQIGVDTDVTFCLKELRAILTFAEFSSQPINVHFETSGK